MRIKVDENIGTSAVDLLREGKHDVMTLREQGLAGAADELVFQACIEEGRTLITLDRDFGQVPRFPPARSAGTRILLLGSTNMPPICAARIWCWRFAPCPSRTCSGCAETRAAMLEFADMLEAMSKALVRAGQIPAP